MKKVTEIFFASFFQIEKSKNMSYGYGYLKHITHHHNNNSAESNNFNYHINDNYDQLHHSRSDSLTSLSSDGNSVNDEDQKKLNLLQHYSTHEKFHSPQDRYQNHDVNNANFNPTNNQNIRHASPQNHNMDRVGHPHSASTVLKKNTVLFRCAFFKIPLCFTVIRSTPTVLTMLIPNSKLYSMKCKFIFIF